MALLGQTGSQAKQLTQGSIIFTAMPAPENWPIFWFPSYSLGLIGLVMADKPRAVRRCFINQKFPGMTEMHVNDALSAGGDGHQHRPRREPGLLFMLLHLA
jgi:hypothetical protein